MKIKVDEIHREIAKETGLTINQVEYICDFPFKFMKREIIEKDVTASLLLPYFGKMAITNYLRKVRNDERNEVQFNPSPESIHAITRTKSRTRRESRKENKDLQQM